MFYNYEVKNYFDKDGLSRNSFGPIYVNIFKFNNLRFYGYLKDSSNPNTLRYGSFYQTEFIK